MITQVYKILLFITFLIFVISCNPKMQVMKPDANYEERVAMEEEKRPENSAPNEIIGIKEELPRFPGCENENLSDKALRQCAAEKLILWIYDNLERPKEAKKTKGSVVAQYTVTKEGRITDIDIVRDIGDGCGDAVKNLLIKMNNEVTWIPGQQAGKLVDVKYTLPVKF